jgi:hypothetical protein
MQGEKYFCRVSFSNDRVQRHENHWLFFFQPLPNSSEIWNSPTLLMLISLIDDRSASKPYGKCLTFSKSSIGRNADWTERGDWPKTWASEVKVTLL